MSGLTERLRKSADLAGERWPDTDAMYEAADRLEAMEAALVEARAIVATTVSKSAPHVLYSRRAKTLARIDTLLGEQ